jgi:hypothetical protein
LRTQASSFWRIQRFSAKEMLKWLLGSEELKKIGTAEELLIASLRGGGTLRKPISPWKEKNK